MFWVTFNLIWSQFLETLYSPLKIFSTAKMECLFVGSKFVHPRYTSSRLDHSRARCLLYFASVKGRLLSRKRLLINLVTASCERNCSDENLISKTGRVDRGTTVYMSPEIVVQGKSKFNASLHELMLSDMWSLGMTVFTMIKPSLKFPFILEIRSSSEHIDGGHKNYLTLEI